MRRRCCTDIFFRFIKEYALYIFFTDFWKIWGIYQKSTNYRCMKCFKRKKIWIIWQIGLYFWHFLYVADILPKGEEVPTNMVKTSFTDQPVTETWCPWTWIRLLPTHCWSIYAAREQQFLIITYIIFIYSSVSGSRANSFLNAKLRKWLFKVYPG